MTTAALPPVELIPDDAIVLHVDAAASHDAARTWAGDQAAAEGRPLLLVAMAPTAPGTAITHGREEEAAAAFVAASAASVVEQHPGLDVHTLVPSTDVVPTLVSLSSSARLLVVGAHPGGLAALVSSWGVDAWLSARTACPVVVVPRHHPGRVRRGVLAGIDLGETSTAVLEFAFREADLHHLPLTVMVCDSDRAQHDEDRRRLSEVTAGFRERFPDVHLTRVASHGRPAHALVEAAAQMHLLVVGRHHRSASLMGHVRGGVVDRAGCPVAVVPVSS
jgi:hypothetical protein